MKENDAVKTSVKEYNLSRPVIVGTDPSIAAEVSRIPQLEIAYRYEVKH